jgi:hypothetical protein
MRVFGARRSSVLEIDAFDREAARPIPSRATDFVATRTPAANTTNADFPRLASIVSRDRFLPRLVMNEGDRLAFSYGILLLSSLPLMPVIIATFKATEALLEYIDQVESERADDCVSVIMPEFVPDAGGATSSITRGRRSSRESLLFRPSTVVNSVPFHLAAQRPSAWPARRAVDTGPIATRALYNRAFLRPI